MPVFEICSVYMCVMNMRGGFLLQEATASALGIKVFTVVMSDDSAASFGGRASINKGNPSLVKASSL